MPQEIAKTPGTKVFFADSYASWQKGTIENMSKFVRQYIPKRNRFQTNRRRFYKEGAVQNKQKAKGKTEF